VAVPRREHQQGLGERVHRVVQHQRAQLLGQFGAAGFARADDLGAALAQPLGQCVDVRGLAGAVDALEGDESAAHGVAFGP
jgi:hypothetical protein